MTSVRLVGVTKRFGEVVALDNVSLSINHGELFTILGPSGCGKTTTLRIIAGFEVPDHGRIYFDDVDVTGLPAYERRVGMVFQSYALWPHMTVFENIAYGLRIMGLSRSEVRRRVREVLELVKLEGLESRYPHQLSGGQQQRVALARALVVEPKVLLLDEPLSNLDAKLRVEMRDELKALQRRLGITTIYVTHDQEEAMTLSDRLAVMNAGKIYQVGTPMEVYYRPKSLFVAEFVGKSSVIEGEVIKVEGERVYVKFGSEIIIGCIPSEDVVIDIGDRVACILRPEHFELNASGELSNAFYGLVDRISFIGDHIEVRVKVDSVHLVAYLDPEVEISIGDRIRLFVPYRKTIVLPLQS